jgi:hypothetical protein
MLSIYILAVFMASLASAAPKHKQVIEWLIGNFTVARDIAVTRVVPPGIFDPNVGGSIIPFGSFPDFDETIDYFYGQFAPLPAGFTLPPIQYYFRNYVESGKTVAFSIDIVNDLPPVVNGDTQTVSNFTFSGFMEFTNSTKSAVIKRYNLIIPRASEWWRDKFSSFGANYESNSRWRQYTINTICGLHDIYCTEANKQFDSFNDCVNFQSSISFGIMEYGYENTVTCRYIHAPMTAARPAVHCAHIGPSGGGFCSGQRSYSSYFSDPINAPIVMQNNGDND